MSRLYEELECGCMISEDGGGGFIPCHASGTYDIPGEVVVHDAERVALHLKANKEYDERLKSDEIMTF